MVYSCSGGSSTTKDKCNPVCGDGYRIESEQCDDGNTINGDGCSSICIIESYYSCIGDSLISKDSCNTKCGDGHRVGSEQSTYYGYLEFDGERYWDARDNYSGVKWEVFDIGLTNVQQYKDAFSLIDKLIEYDHNERILPRDALKHRFLADVSDEMDIDSSGEDYN